MHSLNHQLLLSLHQLITTKPVDFLIGHSLVIGFISGVFSLIPFQIKQLPHIIVLIVAVLAIIYVNIGSNIGIKYIFYSKDTYFIMNFVGRYMIGCIFGLAIANFIQRIRREQAHDTN